MAATDIASKALPNRQVPPSRNCSPYRSVINPKQAVDLVDENTVGIPCHTGGHLHWYELARQCPFQRDPFLDLDLTLALQNAIEILTLKVNNYNKDQMLYYINITVTYDFYLT